MKSRQIINTQKKPKITFKQALKNSPLLLPSAHDALTARLIELAGFDAYQIGIFSVAGSHFAYPDIGLIKYGENFEIINDIITASNLPVLIDAEAGYGDVKNVVKTIQGYEGIGASAIFIEDQQPPIRCGHMKGERVVPISFMVSKVKAAVAARNNPDTFIIARTDARQVNGIDDVIKRLEKYANAGADGLIADGIYTIKDFEKISKEFKGIPLGMIILEGQEKSLWLTKKQIKQLGYAMCLFPTSLIFRVVKTVMNGLSDLKNSKQMDKNESVTFNEYEKMLELQKWAEVEDKFAHPKEELKVK